MNSRTLLSEQATMVEIFHGAGELEAITGEEETI
jgi:hypothetical protein